MSRATIAVAPASLVDHSMHSASPSFFEFRVYEPGLTNNWNAVEAFSFLFDSVSMYLEKSLLVSNFVHLVQICISSNLRILSRKFFWVSVFDVWRKHHLRILVLGVDRSR